MSIIAPPPATTQALASHLAGLGVPRSAESGQLDSLSDPSVRTEATVGQG